MTRDELFAQIQRDLKTQGSNFLQMGLKNCRLLTVYYDTNLIGMAQLHHSTLYIVIQRSLQVVHWCRLVVELFVFLLKKNTLY